MSLQCASTVVVARHAEAAFEEDWFSDEGGSLTPTGRSQAAALSDRLAGRRLAHVWSSDTSRAVQTAEIVAARHGVAVTATKSLREVDIGDLRGQPFSLPALHRITARWFDGDLDVPFAGGESGAAVVARYGDVLTTVAAAHPGETVLVVVHQTAAAIALPALVPDLAPAWSRDHQLANGESVELLAGTDGWTLAGPTWDRGC